MGKRYVSTEYSLRRELGEVKAKCGVVLLLLILRGDGERVKFVGPIMGKTIKGSSDLLYKARVLLVLMFFDINRLGKGILGGD